MNASTRTPPLPAQVERTYSTLLTGVWPVFFTPFKADGGIDYEGLEELVEFYVDAGCVGLFIIAHSGEMYYLNNEERIAFANAVVATARGRLQLIACGNFGWDLQQQIQSIQAMAETGLDAVIVNLASVPWLGDRGCDAELMGNLEKMACETDVPLGIYECPEPEHRVLTTSQVARLAATNRFQFLKETSRNRDTFATKVQTANGTPLKVFQASLKVLLEPLVEGMAGFSGIIANIMPEICVRLCQSPDLEYRERVSEPMMRLLQTMIEHHYPASGKYLLQRRGMPIGPYSRSPRAINLSNGDRATIDKVSRQIDVLLAM